MNPAQIIDSERLSSAFGRIGHGTRSEFGGTGSRVAERPLEGSSRPGPDETSPLERASRPNAERSDSTGGVLSVREFASVLERECSLADRGTRRFSVLALHQRAGTRGDRRRRVALAEIAQQSRTRLRSTDVVGLLNSERVEILLTDTEPAGAQVVSAWVKQVQIELGLDFDVTIYVYPSVKDPSSDSAQERGSHDRTRSNGHGNGALNTRGASAADGQSGAAAEHRAATKGDPIDMHSARTPHESGARRAGVVADGRSSAVPDGRSPMEDLWPRLGVSTPLWKRSLDVVISVFALALLLPVFVLIAIAIRLDSPGPVIFRQMRAGRGGRPFVFYKFRSMFADAEARRAALAGLNEQEGPIFKIRHDPRITRVGRWLRRSSIDELPQLWNVLKGDISLVGPRSPTLDEARQYERWQRRRLCITGGITCTWQVSGRSQIPFREWMRLDMRYVARRNAWLDLRLLALTFPAVLSGRGAS